MTAQQRERQELARLDYEITVLFDAPPQSLDLLKLLGWSKEALDIERIIRSETKRRYRELHRDYYSDNKRDCEANRRAERQQRELTTR